MRERLRERERERNHTNCAVIDPVITMGSPVEPVVMCEYREKPNRHMY